MGPAGSPYRDVAQHMGQLFVFIQANKGVPVAEVFTVEEDLRNTGAGQSFLQLLAKAAIEHDITLLKGNARALEYFPDLIRRGHRRPCEESEGPSREDTAKAGHLAAPHPRTET